MSFPPIELSYLRLDRANLRHCFDEGTVFDKRLTKFSSPFETLFRQMPNRVFYFAGDYHCFHSPVDWTINFRRHFPGALLSVNPAVAKWVAGLFSLNERAVYVGRWQHGFFSMTPVGATNVGSIRVYADQQLRTNCTKWALPLPYYDQYMEPSEADANEIPLRKGEIFGEFNLGSTIVLIFEAPKDFEFNIRPGEKIRMGQPLQRLSQ